MGCTFHRVLRYLDRLPHGLDSYGECKAKASIYRSAMAELDLTHAADPLPQALVQLLQNPAPPGSWIPEVYNNALHLALADLHFGNDDDFVDRAYAANQDLFRSPMYRAMMLLANPQRVLTSAKKRWQTFHLGTDFALEVDGATAQVALTYPNDVHDLLMLQCIAVAFRAAIEAAHGKNVEVGLTQVSSARAEFAGRWT
jgi:hypothetical protein